MDSDVRVVLIKLADRLHNMRTLGAFRMQSAAGSPRRPWISLLHWPTVWESGRSSGNSKTWASAIPTEKYKEIAEQLAVRRESREAEIENIIDAISKLLKEAGVKYEISGRPKAHLFDLQKMMEKGKSFDLVRDVRGVRLIVPDIAACYAALGIIHTHWRPIPNEFDDYIAAPKDNFYQSLHTAVIYDDGRPVEVQIRTIEMDENAEFGLHRTGGIRKAARATNTTNGSTGSGG